MKLRLIGIATVVMALFASCETIEEPKVSVEVLPAAKEQVVFTAGLGVDTKTYLEYEEGVYKTRWSNGDQIFLLGTNSDGSYAYETVSIVEGVGTSVGTFAGSVTAEKYFALYGPGTVYFSGEWLVNLYQYKYSPKKYDEVTKKDLYVDNIQGASYFPMYAESTTTSFNFQNLCAILKVGLTGTDYIDNIVLTPNDPTAYVSGQAFVEIVYGEPVLDFVDTLANNSVCCYFRETLEETAVKNCYISIPPQTFNGGFKLTINSDKGSMEVNITEDITFERSQIRTIPEIKYVNEVSNVWGLVGTINDWGNSGDPDIEMSFSEGYHYITNQYLEAGEEVKFRANGTWDVNLGAVVDPNIVPGEVMQLTFNGQNMIVTETGYYDITLDVTNQLARFDLVEPDYVECASYEEVAALEDGTKVLVQGFVMVPYGRGFIMNVGNYADNSILVYQGTDQSIYTPVMGNVVEIIAEKTTWNNLPELCNIESVNVINNQVRDYGYDSYLPLYNAAAFDSQPIDRYYYVKFAGTLEQSGNYYNVIVEGATVRTGSIEFPLQDLTEFIGKKVSVEGWFIGFADNGKYLKVVLRKIALVDDSGSTEDVVPGDDIVVAKVAANAPMKLR